MDFQVRAKAVKEVDGGSKPQAMLPYHSYTNAGATSKRAKVSPSSHISPHKYRASHYSNNQNNQGKSYDNLATGRGVSCLADPEQKDLRIVV